MHRRFHTTYHLPLAPPAAAFFPPVPAAASKPAESRLSINSIEQISSLFGYKTMLLYLRCVASRSIPTPAASRICSNFNTDCGAEISKGRLLRIEGDERDRKRSSRKLKRTSSRRRRKFRVIALLFQATFQCFQICAAISEYASRSSPRNAAPFRN